MKNLLTVLSIATIAGCGGVECDRDALVGKHMVAFTEHGGGTCGTVGDYEISMTHEAESESCIVTHFSANTCPLERKEVCGYGATVARITDTSLYQDPDGSIGGTTTVTFRKWNAGDMECQSVYELRGTK